MMLSRLAPLIDTLPSHLRLRKVLTGPASRSRARLRYLDLGDCVVRLRGGGGEGLSLVLAADPPVPLERYDDLIATLGNGYRTTVFEMPGFGASLARIGFRFSMASAVAAVARLLEQLPGAPHVLVMPCVTGFVALALAAQRPDLVRALVLPQMPDWAGAQAWLEGRDPRRVLRRPLLGQLLLHALRRHRVGAWYATALGPGAERAPWVEATLRHFDEGGAFPLASAFQDFLADSQGLLQPVALPTLLPWGDADPSHRRTDFARAALLAPQARLARFDGCGHFPELEDSHRFAAALRGFLHETPP
ncbi:MAG: alpha/beta fold hydrolase [Pseudomonadota bacterium]|jgi:pimeloyl-ACP methyl ester carboxylesterase